MIKLFRTSILRTLSIEVNNKDYELHNIIYFNENGIITKIGSGYFDDDKERTYKGNCTRKLKVDFNFKDNFIVKAEEHYENRYDLYVYEKNVNIQFLGNEQKYFGSVYSHWQIDDYELWRYEKSLKNNLSKLNEKAENLVKLIGEEYTYNGIGIEENIFNEKIKELKSLNKKILAEVKSIKEYKI